MDPFIENGVLKIGTKGRHVELPDGWYIVTSGFVKPLDMFIDAHSAQTGVVRWVHVEADEIGEPVSEFAAVIRKKLFHFMKDP